MANKRAKGIANRLALDGQTTAKFVTTFMDYQKEVWALGARVRNKDMADKSDAEVEQAIKQRGNRCRREEELFQKFVTIFVYFCSIYVQKVSKKLCFTTKND